MAPMRHRYDTRLHKRSSGYGRPMAPRAANEMAPGYGTNADSGQYGSGQAHDDGQYHAGGKQAGQGTQQGSSYGSSQGSQQNQQGSSQQGSSGATSNGGTQQGSQQGQQSQQNAGSYGQSGSTQQNQASQQNTGAYKQAGSSQQNSGQHGQSGTSQKNSGYYGQSGSSQQNAAGQQAQKESTNDGSYQSNQGAAQQQSSPDTSSNGGYQSNSSPQKPQSGQQSQNGAAGASDENANSAHGSSAQQQEAQGNSYNYGSLLGDPSSAEKNQSPSLANHDSVYASQHSSELENTSRPSLATDSLLPTDSATATATTSSFEPTTSTSSPTSSLTSTSSPTASPATSSSASPTATPASSNGLTAYQSACAGFGVALGVVVIAGAFLLWLYKRRQQQKPDSAPSEQFHEGASNAAAGSKPRPSEKLHSTFHDGVSSMKTSAAKKGHKTRSSVSSAKKRASSLYGSFVGTAIGTGSGALGAVRKSLQRVPNMQNHQQNIPEDGVRSSNEESTNSVESHERGPLDYNSTEKANASTPTLVVSPTDPAARDMSPTVRHVPSGRPQMERSASVDDRAGISTTPETDGSQGDNQTGTVSPPRGQNLLAITSMVPFLSSQYRVEIAFSAKKPGQMDLREGQCVSIRQSYDDGWVLCSPGEGGSEGFAPRACLSPWPVKSGSSQNNSDGSRTPDSVSAPGTPRFYSHFFSSRSLT